MTSRTRAFVNFVVNVVVRVFLVIYVVVSCNLASADSGAKVDTGSLSDQQRSDIIDQALHILGGNANVITKWVGDVRLAVIGQAGERSTRFAINVVNKVGEITGLKVVVVDHGHADGRAYLNKVNSTPPFDSSACSVDTDDLCADFIVLFSDVETMRELTTAIPLRPVYQRSLQENSADIVCFFAPYVGRQMHIERGFVFIRSDLSEPMVQTCLQEEIFQSFGLFGDVTGSSFFSFNNVIAPKSITSYDEALLKSLYDSDISPGAPVFKVVKRFMGELGF